MKQSMVVFFTGVAAGAVLGILYAPDKGSKTRKKIRKKSKQITSDVTESLNQQVDNMKKNVNEFVKDIKEKFDDIETEVIKLSEQQKAREVR